jgi:dsDNA-specific endonuclease/ATPase MutS2
VLDQGTRCSILTGANSGGKTTLLEHIVQLISLQQLGLPVKGIVSLPLFTEVYYFAKNKGSATKGAFETLLHQLASIVPGKHTLILADEIEAVTEPGVAGRMICATVEYFLQEGCFLVIATHLGQEIQPLLPAGSRIDGIEAKGLTDTFELIVDHTPVLGRLARSTPELIIQRLAYISSERYYQFLAQALMRYNSRNV